MSSTHDKSVNGFSVIAQGLKKQNVDIIYGIIGIPITQLASAVQSFGIRYIGFRNEQAASYAACAAGYLTQKPGVCMTVAGPGFIHALAGLANATANCFPMILLSGSSEQNRAGLKQGDFQEFDQVSAAKPFAKAVFQAHSIDTVGAAVVRAVRTACSGRPGGVYLDLPVNILHQNITEEAAMRIIGGEMTATSLTIPSGEYLHRAIEMINNAQRPVLVIGKGAAYSHAEKELLAFAERNAIPFINTPMAKGLLPDSHELSAIAARSTALREADLAIIAGARLNWILHHGQPPKWSENCKLMQVDICAEEIDSNRHIDLALIGDIRSTFSELNAVTANSRLQKNAEWLKLLQTKSLANRTKMEEVLSQEKFPMDFSTAFSVIRNMLREYPETILVTEGANTLDIGRGILNMELPRKRLDTGTWGTMGVGMGYAIAASTVTNCPVLALEGDAAFGFSAMEIETICRYKLNVITVIFNNGGVYKGDEINAYSQDPAPSRFVDNAAYEKLIEAFGGKGYHAETAEQLKSTLARAFESKQPCLINCIIDPSSGTESGHLTHANYHA